MERIGDEVARTLDRAGGKEGPSLAELLAAWPHIVGQAIARHAWPLRTGRDGTLHVATSSSTWAFELDRLAPEILDRLRAALGTGAPSALRFRPGPLPEAGPAPAAGAAPPRPEPAPEAVAEAEALAAAIDDPELRELVSRAARVSLARVRSDQSI